MLVGRNGAGKTTLLRALVGLQNPTAGAVEIEGLSPHDRRQSKQVMRSVGYVPQGAAIPGGAKVVELLQYSCWLKAIPRRRAPALVEQAAQDLQIEHLQGRRIRSLSGGERQRVSIAMSLVHQPSALIFDEPSVGLDPVQRVGLRGVIDDLSRARAVLVSTHLVSDMGGESDTIVVLRDGAVAFTGSSTELSALATPRDRGATALEQGLWHVLGADQ